MKTRCFYNHKDPPFYMKHQLMSADPLPVIKIDLKYKLFFIIFPMIFIRSYPFFEIRITNLGLSELEQAKIFVFFHC